MENKIDIGIDFGAENIVVVAIGYDNKGRADYKLVNLDSSGSVKNYIGEKKSDKSIEIGNEVKISYIYKEINNDYNWIGGRYKAFIAEKSAPYFEKTPEELIRYGLREIINKIETFDFSPLLSGELNNLTVGVPQSWGFQKKLIYRDILTFWKHGSVNLLSEPVAATIAAYKRSTTEIGSNIIMILDIGASTFDISFARYNEENKNLEIFKTTYRSEWAGHFFDSLFAVFALTSDINRASAAEIIPPADLKNLTETEDFIRYFQENQEKYSSLLLELETIKENHLLEIVKFNRKKLIDIGTKVPVTLTKQIYTAALNHYVSKISLDINQLIARFKETEKIGPAEKIFPFLCGGASSLNGLEKGLKEQIKSDEKEKLFSIIKEGQGNKIDTTIAVGLAFYAQDNSIISKKMEYSIGVSFLTDEDEQRKEFWILLEGEKYPLARDKKLSEVIGAAKELQYYGGSNGTISFPVIQKSSIDENEIHSEIVSVSMENCVKEDIFEIFFNIDIDGIITVTVQNISKGFFSKKSLNLKDNILFLHNQQ
jgi:hypothetical protein